ncbi:MAG: 2Fe-2S iron-sulfur cluster binding domain-containing protein [Alphaproteobacteria bacterium]|nr:2Fe-2S iron-sulfur cluster binding domain-containing protein [Alphaproteobacteria bacterium]
MSAPVSLTVNGRTVTLATASAARLSEALRHELGLTGTKIGCDAGDCGACTVLLDGRQVCACLVPVGQAAGRSVVTVEGLDDQGLRAAFLRHGAAQCGICTPGMLMAASDLLRRVPRPDEQQIEAALSGVLCRCTGYRKIVAAVLDARRASPAGDVETKAMGARRPRIDGLAKVEGREAFGADAVPKDALWLRAIRSPHHHARFEIGAWTPPAGVVRVLTARDVPGRNGFGIYPDIKDQPVLAEGVARYRGEPVLALLGERAALRAVDESAIPIRWTPLPHLHDPAAASAPGAALLHADRPGNLLTEGKLARGDAEAALAAAVHRAAVEIETGFVEHAYIEPEAGWAVRRGDRIEVTVSTQTPYMDRDEVAGVLGIAPEQVRIVPSACGGGFGGKLDQSVQPLIAIAAWLTKMPVAWVYDRPESMAATTKRHPARIQARMGCDADGRLVGFAFEGTFNTGAYASWGPTVAGRVPVHAAGPYRVPAASARARAIFTHLAPAGAFRGFGVPQAAIAHEMLIDDLALASGIDRLEFRRRNALRPDDLTVTGQALGPSAGLVACLNALEPHWRAALERARPGRGVGIGCMVYGIGNTAMSNPSTMRIGLAADGRLTLYSGAVDIGQGSNTVLAQIAAEALGVPADRIRLVAGDTDLTADAGKTSASRQTFVSGKACELAARDLRARLARLANASPEARIALGAGIAVEEGGRRTALDLGHLAPDRNGDALAGEGRFDPPTEPLDANGQGAPYASYAFAAQMAEVAVDRDLGTVKVLRMVAAHDVGRAVNPTLVEGQIEGGIAQGLGLALMEEWWPGQADNLHDYLIPTVGDVPPIETVLIESPEPLGPFGAKGVGEPGLVPTAPAILGAVRHATGVRPKRVPLTPARLRALIAGRSS